MYFPRHNLLNQLQYIAKKNSEAANYFVYLHKSGVYDFDPPTPPKKSTHFGDFFEVIEPVVEGKKGTPKLNAEGQPVFQGRFYRATDLNVFAYRFNPENPPRTTSSALTPVLLATEVNDDGVAETNTLRAFPYIVTPKINAELQDAQSSFKTQFFEEDGSQRTSSWGPAIAPLGGKFSWKKKDAIKALALALTDYIRQESNQTEIIRSELSCYHLKNQPEKDKKPTHALLYDLTCHAIFESLAKFSTFDEVSVETLTTSLINNPDYKRVTYFKGLGSFGKNRNQVYLALGFTVSSLTEKEAHVGLLAIEDNQIYFTPFDLADSPMEKWRSVLLCLMQNEYAKKWLGYIWKAMEVSPTPIELLEPPNVLMLGEKQSDCKLSTQSKSLLPFDIERSVFVPMIKISHLAKDIFSRMKCHNVYLGKSRSRTLALIRPKRMPPATPPVAPVVRRERPAPPEETVRRERPAPTQVESTPPPTPQTPPVENVLARWGLFYPTVLPTQSRESMLSQLNREYTPLFFPKLCGSGANAYSTSCGIVLAGVGSTFNKATGVYTTQPLSEQTAANLMYKLGSENEAKVHNRFILGHSEASGSFYGSVFRIAIPSLDVLKKIYKLFPTKAAENSLWAPGLCHVFSRQHLADLTEDEFNNFVSLSSLNKSPAKIFVQPVNHQDVAAEASLEPVFFEGKLRRMLVFTFVSVRGESYRNGIIRLGFSQYDTQTQHRLVQFYENVVCYYRMVVPQQGDNSILAALMQDAKASFSLARSILTTKT